MDAILKLFDPSRRLTALKLFLHTDAGKCATFLVSRLKMSTSERLRV